MNATIFPSSAFHLLIHPPPHLVIPSTHHSRFNHVTHCKLVSLDCSSTRDDSYMVKGRNQVTLLTCFERDSELLISAETWRT